MSQATAEPRTTGRPPGQAEWALAVHRRSGWRCQGPGCGLSKAEIEALDGQLQGGHIWPYGECDDPLPAGVLGGPTIVGGRPLSARFDPRNGLSVCTFKNRRHPAGIGNGYGCHAVLDRWGSKVPPGTSTAPMKAVGLWGSPVTGTFTTRRQIGVWLAQGFAVFALIVCPLWFAFAVMVGGLGTARSFAWWLFSMIPATLVGLYLSRAAHRTRTPSRVLRWAWSGLRAGLRWLWARIRWPR